MQDCQELARMLGWDLPEEYIELRPTIDGSNNAARIPMKLVWGGMVPYEGLLRGARSEAGSSSVGMVQG